MEKNLTFKDAPMWASQQTIVKILKQVKYKFEPLNEYENTQFICMTQQKNYNPLNILGLKHKDKYIPCPLAITICGSYKGEPVVEPMVFTREDVLHIIKDVPENYVGPDML